MLTVLAAQLYIVMYILMFISGIVLRYSHKKLDRHYKIPFGNIGMWVVATLGILGCLFTFFVGFVPATPVDTGGFLFFELFLAAGLILFCSTPLIIFQLRYLWTNKTE